MKPNDYNPNKVAPPELLLLKKSILETGWTQPIVCDKNLNIIDGFHRWTVSQEKEVFSMTGGKVPVVIVENIDENHKRIATIRHNRARGKHAVLDMASIVTKLISSGMDKQEIMFRLGMEDEEVERLSVRYGMSTKASKDAGGNFTEAWKPSKDA